MGRKIVPTSDISGRDLLDEELVTVVIKSAGKRFDAARDELAALKTVSNVEELEYQYPSGERETVLVTKAELNKLIPAEKVESFDSSRGRRTGQSPLIKSSSNGQGAQT